MKYDSNVESKNNLEVWSLLIWEKKYEYDLIWEKSSSILNNGKETFNNF